MPFTTWIRDLFGIRKDVVDIKKAKLETEKLEAEKRERDLITPATLDDVKKYDPKTKRLINTLQSTLWILLAAVVLIIGTKLIFPKTLELVIEKIQEVLGIEP